MPRFWFRKDTGEDVPVSSGDPLPVSVTGDISIETGDIIIPEVVSAKIVDADGDQYESIPVTVGNFPDPVTEVEVSNFPEGSTEVVNPEGGRLKTQAFAYGIDSETGSPDLNNPLPLVTDGDGLLQVTIGKSGYNASVDDEGYLKARVAGRDEDDYAAPLNVDADGNLKVALMGVDGTGGQHQLRCDADGFLLTKAGT